MKKVQVVFLWIILLAVALDANPQTQNRDTNLGGHPNPAIRGHLKTGHIEHTNR